jgi:hypothetical protein
MKKALELISSIAVHAMEQTLECIVEGANSIGIIPFSKKIIAYVRTMKRIGFLTKIAPQPETVDTNSIVSMTSAA